MKIKPMLPTLREKKRYLAFEVISDQKNDFGTIEASILASVSECVGTIDLAKAGVMVLSDNWNKDTQRGIIRMNNKFVDKVKFALSKIRGKIIFRSLIVSGVLCKAQSAC